MEHPSILSQARESIRNLTRDPVTKLLLASSQVTEAQLETLLAYSLSSESNEKKTKRRLYRPGTRNISRGAFNRTLIQAQNNVIRSIYTVLLLGYVGLFDSPSLQPFTELSDTIQSYIIEARHSSTEAPHAIDQLQARLSDSISSLARRQSFKDLL